MGDTLNFPVDSKLLKRLERARKKLNTSLDDTIIQALNGGLDMILNAQVQAVEVDPVTFLAINDFTLGQNIPGDYPVNGDLADREEWAINNKMALYDLMLEGWRAEEKAKKIAGMVEQYRQTMSDLSNKGHDIFRLCAETVEDFEDGRINKRKADQRMKKLIGKTLIQFLDMQKEENPGIDQFAVRKKLRK